MNTYIHPSKKTADKVAEELHAIGWKTEVVPVAGKFEVRYWQDAAEFHGPHRRKEEIA
jgi:hypothetical protein